MIERVDAKPSPLDGFAIRRQEDVAIDRPTGFLQERRRDAL
jgi:hypothetical protein